jgi:tagaturonate reductase
MDDQSFSSFITNLIMDEISPSITTKDLTIEDAKTFAGKVLDRYRNPYIAHHWLSITMQYSSKMRMRNESTIKNYLRLFKTVPPYMALGFAGYLLFMKSVQEVGNKYYGEANGKKYLINDESAAYYHDAWLHNNNESLVEKALRNEKLWGDDLSMIPGFADAVNNYLQLLISKGAKKTIENMERDK